MEPHAASAVFSLGTFLCRQMCLELLYLAFLTHALGTESELGAREDSMRGVRTGVTASRNGSKCTAWRTGKELSMLSAPTSIAQRTRAGVPTRPM